MKTHHIARQRATAPVKPKKHDVVADNALRVEKLGREAANTRLSGSRTKSSVAAPRRIELDHVALDFLVVGNHGKLLGRPYLSMALCLRTRTIVGWHVGLERPTSLTAIQTLRAAATKITRHSSLKQPRIRGWGAVDQIITDNGTSFHSTPVVAASEALGQNLHLASAPHAKSTIERFFRHAVKELVKSQRVRRDNGAMTIEELEQAVQSWVAQAGKSTPAPIELPKKERRP
ncbi:DDE-type integrase/transposase/recombinase [Bradyrhizobium yuanmingense]|uniref:DDE-type integrase/transposase/recombinase n=1 Tax=Bradyrhizobium yuanmingense TaxID=108015 RepID=UPI0012FA3AF5|nr:DDE-type integrase/transposase/recombinase [Bradyrhizobium yuanmingense]MVT52593.1 DDE-type integrase/transposase/recombinase [Bradyrhizobium yuanmingense]